MKTLTTLMALIVGASLVQADIQLNENLTISGFIDSSYSHSEDEMGSSESSSENSFDVDQVEIDFILNFDQVSGQIDIQSIGGKDLHVEQAFFSYDLGNGSSISAGQMDGMLGFEAKEPTGLYQYSTAYDVVSQVTGVKYAYEADGTFITVSLLDGYNAYGDDGRLGGSGSSNYAVEVAVGSQLTDNLSSFVGAFFEDFDTSSSNSGDAHGFNAYIVYEQDALTAALELFYTESDFGNDDSGVETIGGLAMINYVVSEQGSVTGRISYVEEDFGSYYDAHSVQYTAAYSHAVTENLLLVLEVSFADGDYNNVDEDSTMGALEAIFTF